jgi:hypothetical protein
MGAAHYLCLGDLARLRRGARSPQETADGWLSLAFPFFDVPAVLPCSANSIGDIGQLEFREERKQTDTHLRPAPTVYSPNSTVDDPRQPANVRTDDPISSP